MGTGFNSFAASPLGSFIRSPLGERNADGGLRNGIYVSVFPGTTGGGLVHGPGVMYDTKYRKLRVPAEVETSASTGWGFLFGGYDKGYPGFGGARVFDKKKYVGPITELVVVNEGTWVYNGSPNIIPLSSDIPAPGLGPFLWSMYDPFEEQMVIYGYLLYNQDTGEITDWNRQDDTTWQIEPYVNPADGSWWFADMYYNGSWVAHGGDAYSCSQFFYFDGDIHAMAGPATSHGSPAQNYYPLRRYNSGAWDVIAWFTTSNLSCYPLVGGGSAWLGTDLKIRVGPNINAPTSTLTATGIVKWDGGGTFTDIGANASALNMYYDEDQSILYRFGGTSGISNGAEYYDGSWHDMGVDTYDDGGTTYYPSPLARDRMLFIPTLGTSPNNGLWRWNMDDLAFEQMDDLITDYGSYGPYMPFIQSIDFD